MSPELARLRALVLEMGAVAKEMSPSRVVELKGDRSLVTNVDRHIETLLRKSLPEIWPGTTVWGEEFGFEPMGQNGLWLVDPIDGTSNFAYGNPLWGISISLMDSQGIRLGAIVLPELGHDLMSEKGQGAFWNGERMPMIPAGEIQETQLISVNDSAMRKSQTVPIPGKLRLSGAFVIDGAFTAKQWYRALIGVNEKLYDVASCVLAGRELGAVVQYLDGSLFDEQVLARDIPIAKPWGIFPAGSQPTQKS